MNMITEWLEFDIQYSHTQKERELGHTVSFSGCRMWLCSWKHLDLHVTEAMQLHHFMQLLLLNLLFFFLLLTGQSIKTKQHKVQLCTPHKNSILTSHQCKLEEVQVWNFNIKKNKSSHLIHKSPVKKTEILLFQPEPCWILLFTFISLFQAGPLWSCINDGRWDYRQCQWLLSLVKGL